jgi:hypothetical protein
MRQTIRSTLVELRDWSPNLDREAVGVIAEAPESEGSVPVHFHLPRFSSMQPACGHEERNFCLRLLAGSLTIRHVI